MEIKDLLITLLLIFFIANAIFWGIYSHETHCDLVSYINKMVGSTMKCPSHKLHLLWGFVCYSISVYIAQTIN
uniref:Uncharacterized protein n=1 Tax=viral metagenome TaxID=1070528 RepID=A0A6C0F664_9ZZZZ